MKKVLMFLAMGFVLMAGSCKETATGPNDLGGDPNLDYTKVGTQYNLTIVADSDFVNVRDSVIITKNDNGVVRVRVFVPLVDLQNSKFAPYVALMPADFKDSAGNFNTEFVMKATTEGMQSFDPDQNNEKKPFTIAKYNCAVGDKYEFTTVGGKKLTRTVISKSTTDDFAMGFLLIKTTVVEQNSSRYNGIQKIRFRVNHKFGLVQVVIVMIDGSEVKIGVQ